MQLKSLDELDAQQNESRLLLQTAFFGSTPREHLRLLRRRRRLTEYIGVFAVQGKEVLGQAFVHQLPYEGRNGREILPGLAMVVTRPDHPREGIAESVLRDIHERERAAGRDHIALWTNRSWGAHRLYEQLGYRDVFHPTLAGLKVRPRGSPHGPRGLTFRPGRRSDLPALQELHERATRGRKGYIPRWKHALETFYETGLIDPAHMVRIALRGRRPVGYAVLELAPTRAYCGELVAEDDTVRRGLIGYLESIAPERFLAFHNTASVDALPILDRRGYAVLRSSWIVLMAAPLRGRWTAAQAVRALATDDPSWVCYTGDRF